MTTDTKKMVERIPLEVLNKGNFDLIDELVSPDFVEHFVQPGVPATREGFKQSAIALKTAFPDLRYVDRGLSRDRRPLGPSRDGQRHDDR